MSEVTKRLMTDTTGQDIVQAIEDLSTAVKPNATDIHMSSSDSTSVAQKIDNEVATIADSIAIVAEGNVHAAIAAGQFVYVRNHPTLAQGGYKATAAIGTNATLSTSNLTLDNTGGLNDLQAQITSLNSNISTTNNSLNKLGEQINASNAGAHNGIYRGKYLGTSVTAAQYTAIRNGTFDDLYLGDYWTIGGHNWVICDFDYYIRCGSVDVNQHHLVMMPSGNMNIPAGTALYGASGTLALLDGESATAKKWNATSGAPSTHTTAGGYKYSRMRTIIMKAANTIVINAFGSSHVLPFTELYYSPAAATDSGLASGWAWFDKDSQSDIMCKSICDLCNETMVYGQQVWGRGSAYTNVGCEIGIDKFQLAIFALNRNFANIRANWWLRSVSSATSAAVVDGAGTAASSGSANANGVRPRFLLVG